MQDSTNVSCGRQQVQQKIFVDFTGKSKSGKSSNKFVMPTLGTILSIFIFIIII